MGKDNTWVATCDQEIMDFVESVGSNAVMTSVNHDRASDRTAEAVIAIEKIQSVNYDIVVMLQGDEPLITADMILSSFKPLLDYEQVMVSNLMSRINTEEIFDQMW